MWGDARTTSPFAAFMIILAVIARPVNRHVPSPA